MIKLNTGARILNISRCEDVNRITMIDDFKSDNNLKFAINRTIVHEAFTKLHNFINLKKLTLKTMTLSHENLKHIPTLPFNNMKFKRCIFEYSIIKYMPPTIQSLTLYHCTNTERLYDLEELQTLEELKICMDCNEPENMRNFKYVFRSITKLKNLKKLSITTWIISEEMQLKLYSKLSKLEFLFIEPWENIHINSSISKLTKLKHLTIAHIKGLFEISELTELESLALYSAESIDLPLNIISLNLKKIIIRSPTQNISTEFAKMRSIQAFECNNPTQNVLIHEDSIIIFRFYVDPEMTSRDSTYMMGDSKIPEGITHAFIEQLKTQTLDNLPLSLETLVINNCDRPPCAITLTNLPPGLKTLKLTGSSRNIPAPNIKLPFGCELIII
ncbi:MAG: hypothetical protein Gaeavirus7_7 [Gaeavirus sp.]|uniref:Uncharacterized protein n=1 Tax=Gaeavirus sp. TaxID=2487767 RepID=A0A3G4ZYW2_9VIRU|nr:MAG: hypothetical protein Gaeavirus7_7 [Gaeavirus sp.]